MAMVNNRPNTIPSPPARDGQPVPTFGRRAAADNAAPIVRFSYSAANNRVSEFQRKETTMLTNQARAKQTAVRQCLCGLLVCLLALSSAGCGKREVERRKSGALATGAALLNFPNTTQALSPIAASGLWWMGPAFVLGAESALRGFEAARTEEAYRQGQIEQHERLLEHAKGAAGGLGSVTGTIAGAVAGAQAGAMMGAVLGPLGASAGGLLGLVTGALGGGLLGENAAYLAVDTGDRVLFR